KEVVPMDSHASRWSFQRVAVLTAVVVGVAAGSYGVASAASGSGSGSGSGKAPAAAPSSHRPWGPQRSDETPLTGDALAKVTQLAKAKVPGGTIVRVETDADGNAAYEAHMVRADGTPVTVYVSRQFEVVSVESGMPARPGPAPSSSNGASA
ncbi:MAG TPA: hypothetical protein VH305_06325, partial [Gaiella sp.]